MSDIIANRQFQAIADYAFERARRDGLLIVPEVCSRCGGGGQIDGHHTDYARPFDIEWLCRGCHNCEHRRVKWLRARKVRPVISMQACGHCNGTGEVATPRPLTATQREVYEFLWQYRADHGLAPSFEEIATRFGYSSLATVHEHLSNLERKFWIARRFNDARAITYLVDLNGSEAVA